MDALLLCMGEDVEVVSAYSTHSTNADFAKYEYPTTSVTILKFKDGTRWQMRFVIDCLQPYYFHVHLVGSEGSLLDNKIYSAHFGGLDKSRWSQLSMKLLDSGDVADHPYQRPVRSVLHRPRAGRRDAAHQPRPRHAHARSHLRR
jgi:predicted dehydrogenase